MCMLCHTITSLGNLRITEVSVNCELQVASCELQIVSYTFLAVNVLRISSFITEMEKYLMLTLKAPITTAADNKFGKKSQFSGKSKV